VTSEGHVDCVQLLVAHGAVDDDADVQGYTPLKYAIACGHHGCARLLLHRRMERDPSGAADEIRALLAIVSGR
jgi:ankyrin repeat protein